jgi:hypothetical protein
MNKSFTLYVAEPEWLQLGSSSTFAVPSGTFRACLKNDVTSKFPKISFILAVFILAYPAYFHVWVRTLDVIS